MTATRSRPGTIQFESPPAGIPGLAAGDEATPSGEPEARDAARGETVSAASTVTARFNPALNLQPVIFTGIRQWWLTVALTVWLSFTAASRDTVIFAVALLLAAGLMRSLIEHRIARGVVAQRGGQTVANFGLLVAAGFAGVVGSTLVSPVILVVPALVWSIAAVAPRQWMIDVSSWLSIMVVGSIAVLSASQFADSATTVGGSIALGGTAVVAILLASVHGHRVGPQMMYAVDDGPTQAEDSEVECALATVRRSIAAQSDPIGIATTAARAVNEAYDPAYIAIVEQTPGNQFVPLAEVVNDASCVDLGRRLAGITDSALTKGTPVWMLDDADDTYTVTCRRLGIQAALIVPLEHLSHRIGAIQIAWSKPLGPVLLSEALSYLSEVGKIITPDLAIAQFAAEIERGYFDAISSLAARVDDRDEFTRGHSQRVAKHALTIAEALDLDDNQQRKLLYAAELHDIGRIGVSEDILSKPGALSAQEWAQVRAYPRISADVVEPISFFTDVREIVLHQNERWDGKGYPDHLTGAQIPLLARILAVADAFDAMTSPRPYRSAMTAQAALTELWKARGAKYDPDVVEAFVMSGSIRQKTA